MKAGEYYPFEFMDVSYIVSKEKGTPGYEFLLKVKDGEEVTPKRFTLWITDSLYKTGPNAGKSVTETNFAHLRDQFGMPDEMDPESFKEFYRGKSGKAKMEVKTYRGKSSIEVGGIYSSTLQSTAVMDPGVLAKLNNIRFQLQPAASAADIAPKKTAKKSFFPKKDA